MRTELDLLGYKVSGRGIRPQPEKISAIKNLIPPTNVKGVRSFLGMTGYYRQCLENYAKIAQPIVALTRKSVPFEWSEECQVAFDRLKTMLTTDPVMAHPRTDLPYTLHTDACGYAVGAILCQRHEDGIEHVVQYVSHQLSGSQLNWAVCEKEAYAVVYAV